ncbi:MAG TPA: hypothetical protein VHB02_05955 [Acidimicrobiales bacterium]|nr:hypothetical protein [Acidimicrobiales bacterium]
MTSALTFTPAVVEYTRQTDEVLEFDLSATLASVGGTEVADITATLTDLVTGREVPVGTPAATSATAAMLRLQGSILEAGHRYRLTLRFGADPTSNVCVLALGIVVSF